MTGRFFRRVIAAVLAVLLVAAVQVGPPPRRAVAGTSIPTAVSDELTAILNAANLHDSIAPTLQVLSEAGFDVIADDGTLMTPGTIPVSEDRLFEGDVVGLASDARLEPGTHGLTLVDVATYMKGLRAPFPEGNDPALAMRAMLAAWVNSAIATPGDPTVFNPLFLAASAARQGIDLGDPTYDPATLWFSRLDLQVLGAGVERNAVLPPAARPTAPSANSPAARARVPARVRTRVRTRVKPCSNAGKEMEKVHPIVGAAVMHSQGFLGTVVKNAGVALVSFGDATAKELTSRAVGKLLTAVKIFMRIVALAQYYEAIGIRAYGDPAEVQMESSPQETYFFAVAGLSDTAANQLSAEQAAEGIHPIATALKDCWKAWGLPTLPSLEDLAKGLKTWRVQWDIHPECGLNLYCINYAATKWAVMNSRQTPLTPVSATEGGSQVEMTIEDDPGPPLGAQVFFEIPAEVSVDASGMPDLPILSTIWKGSLKGVKVLTNASKNPKNWSLKFGLAADLIDPMVYADSISAIAAEMFKKLIQPSTHAEQKVLLHKDCSGLRSLVPVAIRMQIRATGVCQLPTGWSGTINWSRDFADSNPLWLGTDHQTGTLTITLTNDPTVTHSLIFPQYATPGVSGYSVSGSGTSSNCNDSYAGSGSLDVVGVGSYTYLQAAGSPEAGSAMDLIVAADIEGTETCPDFPSGTETHPYYTNPLFQGLDPCLPPGVDPTRINLGGAGGMLGFWNGDTQAWSFDCAKSDTVGYISYTVTISGTLAPTYG